VAADAGVVVTVSTPLTVTAMTAAAANPDRRRRRHLAGRANVTDIASFLSII
jgi:hypothetical protein